MIVTVTKDISRNNSDPATQGCAPDQLVNLHLNVAPFQHELYYSAKNLETPPCREDGKAYKLVDIFNLIKTNFTLRNIHVYYLLNPKLENGSW